MIFRETLGVALRLFSRGGVVKSCFSLLSPYFLLMHWREKGTLMLFKSHFSLIFQTVIGV
jgi:hypothetical protein